MPGVARLRGQEASSIQQQRHIHARVRGGPQRQVRGPDEDAVSGWAGRSWEHRGPGNGTRTRPLGAELARVLKLRWAWEECGKGQRASMSSERAPVASPALGASPHVDLPPHWHVAEVAAWLELRDLHTGSLQLFFFFSRLFTPALRESSRRDGRALRRGSRWQAPTTAGLGGDWPGRGVPHGRRPAAPASQARLHRR